MDKLKEAMGSKRFWAVVITGALTSANSYLKVLDDNTMLQLIGVVAALVVGDSMRPIGK